MKIFMERLSLELTQQEVEVWDAFLQREFGIKAQEFLETFDEKTSVYIKANGEEKPEIQGYHPKPGRKKLYTTKDLEAILEANGSMRYEDLIGMVSESIGCSRPTVKRLIREALENGVITKKGALYSKSLGEQPGREDVAFNSKILNLDEILGPEISPTEGR